MSLQRHRSTPYEQFPVFPRPSIVAVPITIMLQDEPPNWCFLGSSLMPTIPTLSQRCLRSMYARRADIARNVFTTTRHKVDTTKTRPISIPCPHLTSNVCLVFAHAEVVGQHLHTIPVQTLFPTPAPSHSRGREVHRYPSPPRDHETPSSSLSL